MRASVEGLEASRVSFEGASPDGADASPDGPASSPDEDPTPSISPRRRRTFIVIPDALFPGARGPERDVDDEAVRLSTPTGRRTDARGPEDTRAPFATTDISSVVYVSEPTRRSLWPCLVGGIALIRLVISEKILI